MSHDVQAVKYIGVATRKILSEEDFRLVHVEGQPKLVWSSANGFTVLGDRITDGAIAYMKDEEPDLVMVYREEEPEETPPRPTPKRRGKAVSTTA